MLLSDLYAALAGIADVTQYATWLAEPDADGTDVDLALVGRVELDYDGSVVRLYPASPGGDPDAPESAGAPDPEPSLAALLTQLPMEVDLHTDMRLLGETPLLRDAHAAALTSLVDVEEVHVGRESAEVWLLLRPASAYAAGLLPD